MKASEKYLASTICITATLACAAWLWCCWCTFPWRIWNEVRLEPTFLYATGGDAYPPVGAGPVTTWIYGPGTLLLLLPATLANSAVGALLIAGAINTLLVCSPIVACCTFWPNREPVKNDSFLRWSTALFCIAVWPRSSLQFIQADNAAVCLELFANLVLVCRPNHARGHWLACILAVSAIGCKQTAIGALTAHIIYFGVKFGWKASLAAIGRAAMCAAVLTVLTVFLFRPTGLWYNMVEIPAALPWTDQPTQRCIDLIPLFAAHLLAPILIFILFRSSIWARESPFLLPAITFLCSLGVGLLSLFKIGGTINSLQCLVLCLPPLTILVASVQNPTRNSIIVGGTALLVFLLRIAPLPATVWKPIEIHIRQADLIAKSYNNQVWFPWNPITSFYAQHRFDHAEDGLFVRGLTGHPVSAIDTKRNIPQNWAATAFLTNSSDWNIARSFSPQCTEKQTYGLWTIYRNPPPQ